MKPLSWILLWSALLPLGHLSAPEGCPIHGSDSYQDESLLLNSLRCYNDYDSFIVCEWKEHRNMTPWIQIDSDRAQCVPDDAQPHDASGHRMSRCKYETRYIGTGIKHIVFFLQEKTETLCSSAPRKDQHIRARPPVQLSSWDPGDGGRQLSWSSPYPASSTLSKNITYQLSYRADGQDHWKNNKITNTGLKLKRTELLPGQRYEARVRAKATVGQWSHWSPVVTWQTENNEQIPSVDCVLDGEQEVTCSWEVSREQAHFITYQLACRHSHEAQYETCCHSPVVSSSSSTTAVKYSCSLRAVEPVHLLLRLQPARAAKVFESNEHIRPNPPQQVKVKEKDNVWVVEWTESTTSRKLRLIYQVCYYTIEDQKCDILDLSEGSLSMNILHTSLVPSKQYKVKVRSLLIPQMDSNYRGIPSEWTESEEWTSHEATVPLNTLIYVAITVFVAVAIVALYCTVTTCQRKVILWVDSVPSPRKSKTISEIQTATSRALLQTEKTSMCKVLHMDSVSTYCSDTSLWPPSHCGTSLQQDEGCWTCATQGSLATEVNSSAMSAMSFSGPYIFCQESKQNAVDGSCEETEKSPSSSEESAPLPHPNLSLQREGYVCMPSRRQDQQHADTAPQEDKSEVQPSLSLEASSSPQPPAYISGPITSWPQGGTVQASGYFQIPTG